MYHSQNTSSNCIETFETAVAVFHRTGNGYKHKENITNQVIRKCCPRNFCYDSQRHTCTNSSLGRNTLVSFSPIGLFHCLVIMDYKISSTSNAFNEINRTHMLVNDLSRVVSKDSMCFDKETSGEYIIRICEDLKICEAMRCIHKCCPDGHSFVNGSKCEKTWIHGINLELFSGAVEDFQDNFAIIHGYSPLYPIQHYMKYRINSRGTFFVSDRDGNKTYLASERSYCFEHATKGGRTLGYVLFRFFPNIEDVPLDTKFMVNRWAMAISVVFLLITSLFYIFTKETRKVFGKCLVSLCFSLLILFVMLAAYIPFKKNLLEKRYSHVCKSVGFLITYLSFSCFIWFQVLCFDIYRTFGSSSNQIVVDKKKRNMRRFLYFSLYGWGVPLLLTSLPALFHYKDVLPAPIRVEVAVTKCIIEKRDGNYAEIVFRIIPLTIIQVADIILFVKTIRYCLKVRKDIQKLSENNSKKKRFSVKQERLVLVIKLSVTMGMLFLFELISSFVDFKMNPTTANIEIIWDVINCLQGLFIFIIFVCKKKTFEGCKKRIDIDRLRKISLTSNTRVTSVPASTRRIR
ncbi:unnamed protein product [Acanthoscelides obtectus]|uniref:G-protein coupled receptors family 2 profile 2 domain-containing protein n=1 Tax=Acanthoscelides obtectus TaxID=200917 RepID=A0A9P0PYM5_ACAOB|nr:unnamed protein product [Acanthoscelides obtectus]CAK1648574.1 G-protein coupled receptor Mth [Acanthoscelides obtectus]